jgi:Predicted nucleotide-binding protein containing TIR-like domain
MKIFIGSSGESRKTAEELAAFVIECGHEPMPWYNLKAFPPGDVTFTRLIELSKEVDGAVFVFSEDDQIVSRTKEKFQPRDNVILEFGLFARSLGPRKAIICKVGEPSLPLDIAGVTWIKVTNMDAAMPRLRDWLIQLESGGVREIGDEITIDYLKHSERERFTERLSERLATAHNVVMTGSGVAVLGRPSVVSKLMQRAASGECTVTIHLANPYSPAVETRLIEEEQGLFKPPDGKNGLLGRLATLLHAWRTFGSPDSVSIKVGMHYPTFALIIVDDEYFIYPYSYCTLGNYSPVFVFSKKTPAHAEIIHFFDEHYRRIKEDAIDAELMFGTENLRQDALHSFAVYFIPEGRAELYRLGSEVLGYDVRAKKSMKSKWETCVDRASLFGFHLTICDALYFPNEGGIRAALAEVEYLICDFPQFELTDLAIEVDFPEPGAVSISVRDPSGELGCLHYEMVHRLYRRAFASNYTLGLPARRQFADDEEDFLMRRYGAPYILHRFNPHFTLLNQQSHIPKDYEQLKETFDSLFSTEKKRRIKVDGLAVMSWSPVEGRWTIAKEFKLPKPGYR